MITHRPYDALGGADREWLKARLHIAIGGTGNSAHGAFGALRVWNDDEIAPASGFPMHEHRNLEIISYVRDGAITHEDSLGNKGRTEAGDVQVNECRPWHPPCRIQCRKRAHPPLPDLAHAPHHRHRAALERPPLPRGERGDGFVPLASGDPADVGALPINADARLLGVSLHRGETVTHALVEGRSAYLVTTSGRVTLNGLPMSLGDGAGATNEPYLVFEALDDTEIVLVELT